MTVQVVSGEHTTVDDRHSSCCCRSLSCVSFSYTTDFHMHLTTNTPSHHITYTGRRIYIHVGFNGTEKYTAKSRMRVTAHVLMSLLDDIETQQKGMIIISWYQHVTIFDDFFVREKTISKMHCLPIRVCGVHVVVPTITHGTNDAGSSSTSSTSNNTVHDACKGTFNNIFTKMTAFAIGKLFTHMTIVILSSRKSLPTKDFVYISSLGRCN